MKADIQKAGAGTGTNHQEGGRTDAGDTTSESLEGKKWSAIASADFSTDSLIWMSGSFHGGTTAISQV